MAGPDSVRGLRLRVGASALNYYGLRLVGGRLAGLLGGRLPWLALEAGLPMPLRGADWVRLRPMLSGVCGTDLGLLTGKLSPVLSPFNSFPAVLGHEVLARVAEVGSEVSGVGVGDRVVLDPVIGCVVRGLEPCAPCTEGHAARCLRATDGELGPGMLIGFCRALPGGWSDELLAHTSQLHAVPDEVPDAAAALVEPFSVALHGVLAAPPSAGERVMVIGGGALGLCTVAGLHLVSPEADVTVIARHPAQVRLAERLGASRVVRARGVAGAVAAAVEHAGARRHRPFIGPPVLAGGFAQVYESVGNRDGLDAALRVTGPGGRVVLVGGPTLLGELDLTLAWTRELRIDGSYVYGRETSLPGAPHTIDHALALLAAHPELPLGELVTHRFALEEWPEALRAALDRRRSGAVKVVFEGRMAA